MMARGARRKDLGRAGEEAALLVYRRAGFRVVARNWRCPLGELDLVLERGGLIVFCEVKSRRGTSLGGGHDAVTLRKQLKLRQLAQAFLGGRHDPPRAVRFDVASVWMPEGAQPVVQLYPDAF